MIRAILFLSVGALLLAAGAAQAAAKSSRFDDLANLPFGRGRPAARDGAGATDTQLTGGVWALVA